ncbi:hypothetical protein K490DRAFT_56681 [Saccharata proteae CBS 121410]|uniref:Uncharacterized protein n=1 Tax=Saccharata proteae CBS 121410 TaxID=1314787 RepID=A0A9P4HT92_9PEZI|nr:hypothetical protein K490DRAFT_56681 [Saccharata proteae CBS 121410]
MGTESAEREGRSNSLTEERDAPMTTRQTNSRGKLPKITKRKRPVGSEVEREDQEEDLEPATTSRKQTKPKPDNMALAAPTMILPTESRDKVPENTTRRLNMFEFHHEDADEDIRDTMQTRSQLIIPSPASAGSGEIMKRKQALELLGEDENEIEVARIEPSTTSRRQTRSQIVFTPSSLANPGKVTNRKRSNPAEHKDLDVPNPRKEQSRTHQSSVSVRNIFGDRCAPPSPSSAPDLRSHSHSTAYAPSDDGQSIGRLSRVINIHLPLYLVPLTDFKIEIPRLQGVEMLQHSLDTDHPFPTITPVRRHHWMNISVALVRNGVVEYSKAKTVPVTVGHELVHLLEACEKALGEKGLKKLWVRWTKAKGDLEWLRENTEVDERNAVVFLHLMKVRGSRDVFEYLSRGYRPDDIPRARDSDYGPNPFISFRQFADATISSMLNSVISLPQAMSAPRKPHNNDDQPVPPKSWIEEYMESSGSKPNTGAGSSGDKDNDDDDDEDSLHKWIKRLEKQADITAHEVKPKVYEDEHGNKAWHWSWSWGWPPKDGGQSAPGTDDVDEHQRKTLKEAIRNADAQLRDAERRMQAFFGFPVEGFSLDSECDIEVKRNLIHTQIERLDKDVSRAFRHVFGSEERLGRAWYRSFSGIMPELRWLAEHPYGPGYLEWRYRDEFENLQKPPPFMDAFEDLIRLERGEPMVQRQERRTHALPGLPIPVVTALIDDHPSTRSFRSEMRPGGKWFVPLGQGPEAILGSNIRRESGKLLGLPAENKSIDERGVLGAFNPAKRMEFVGATRPDQGPVQGETADPQSEAEMYEHFLNGSLPNQPNAGRTAWSSAFGTDRHEESSSPNEDPASITTSSTPSAQQIKPSPSQQPQTDPSSSRILSMLTTTHRSVEADGSVTTKVVLKKRFADGREETSETVNTESGNGAQLRSRTDDGAAGGKKGGWFWAS